jgi:hypothetical protein
MIYFGVEVLHCDGAAWGLGKILSSALGRFLIIIMSEKDDRRIVATWQTK